jgi:hypothetical protein
MLPPLWINIAGAASGQAGAARVVPGVESRKQGDDPTTILPAVTDQRAVPSAQHGSTTSTTMAQRSTGHSLSGAGAAASVHGAQSAPRHKTALNSESLAVMETWNANSTSHNLLLLRPVMRSLLRRSAMWLEYCRCKESMQLQVHGELTDNHSFRTVIEWFRWACIRCSHPSANPTCAIALFARWVVDWPSSETTVV